VIWEHELDGGLSHKTGKKEKITAKLGGTILPGGGFGGGGWGGRPQPPALSSNQTGEVLREKEVPSHTPEKKKA